MDEADCKRKKRNNLWRLLAYVKPYWPYFAVAAACGMVKMLYPVVLAWLIGEVINTLNKADAGKISASAATAQLRHLVLIGVGVAVVVPVPIYLRSAYGARAVQEVVRNLRCDLYAHIQKLSHSFFDSNRSGSLTSRIIGDVEQIQPFIGRAFVQLWMSLGMIVVVLGYFFSKSVYLGLISICLIPIQLIIQRKIGWRVKENSRIVRDQLSYLSGTTQEKLAAATIVKTFTGEDDEIRRFSDETSALVDLGVANSRLSGVSEGTMGFTRLAAQLILILAGGYLALSRGHTISVGLLVQFILMQGQVYMPFEWLNEMQLVVAAALGATDRIFTIFDTEPEIADKPGAVKAPRFVGEIVLENVCFSYPSSSRPIFQDLNLVAPARTTLALVGPSGGGKSTVTSLLNRFYDWDSGRILIDGKDIRDYTVYSLRSQIGLVPQEPILFSGTIEDNILYGRPDASPEEVREAAQKAYATEFIEEMDEGFDTMLGERGVRLSGGQKQRVSIARAFLKDPAIIVLDEATSSLDSESELIVQQAIEELMHDRTTLVIAHRLSTIRQADQIAVIDDGRVVELGRHEDLLQQDGIYARLCRQQFEALPVTWVGYRDE
ncbi:MAG: ABC transporter ATP-binding protein [Armatimonadota bacterium]|nr:ABC transporter ATP-binding protein [Armatimonadota bacterium]